MYFSLPSIQTRLLLGVLVSGAILSCTAAPADPLATITIGPPKPPIPTIPASCSIKNVAPSCYTATTTVTESKCPKRPCSQAPIACPLVIRITTTEIPCSTDCCPVTPTKTITKPCPGCITRCVIPTETITVTTGCPKSSIPTKVTKTKIPLPTKTLWPGNPTMR